MEDLDFSVSKSVSGLHLGNRLFGDGGCIRLCGYLNKLGDLEILQLEANEISGVGLGYLLPGIEKLIPSLRVLSLEWNPVGGESFDRLCYILAESKKLEYFNIKECHIGLNNANSLSFLIRQNRSLKSLVLSHNSLGSQGGSLIYHALISNKLLCCLDLSGNEIGYKISLAIEELLRRNNCDGKIPEDSTIEQLNNQIADLTLAITKLEGESEEKNRSHDEHLRSKDKELAFCKNKILTLERLVDNTNKLNKVIEVQQTDIDKLKEKNDLLELVQRSSESNSENLQKKLGKKERDLEDLKVRYYELMRNFELLKSEKEKVSDQLVKLENDEKLQDEKSIIFKQKLIDEKSCIKDKYDNMVQLCNNLNKENELLKLNNDNLNESESKAVNNFNKLNQTYLDHLKKSEERYNVLSEEYSKITNDNEVIKHQYEELNSKFEACKAIADVNENKNNQLKIIIDQLQKEKKELNQSYLQLQYKFDQQDSSWKHLVNDIEQRADLRDFLIDSKEETIQLFQQQNESLKAEHQKLLSQIHNYEHIIKLKDEELLSKNNIIDSNKLQQQNTRHQVQSQLHAALQLFQNQSNN